MSNNNGSMPAGEINRRTPHGKLLNAAASLARMVLPEAPIRPDDRDRFEDGLRRLCCQVRDGMDGMAAEVAALRAELADERQTRVSAQRALLAERQAFRAAQQEAEPGQT